MSQRISAAAFLKAQQAQKSEDDIQKDIVKELRAIFPADHILSHARNEGNRGGMKGIIDGKRGEAMGVKPGFPDLLIFADGQGYCIEVKRPGEKLSKVQELVKAELARQSIPFAVCHSASEARATVEQWGIRLRVRSA